MKTTPVKMDYPMKVAEVLADLLGQEPDWKARADQLEQMVVGNGLLPESCLPLSRESPMGFAMNLIQDQDIMLENSNLINLEQRKWDPESATSAKVLVRRLLVMEREQAEQYQYPKYKPKPPPKRTRREIALSGLILGAQVPETPVSWSDTEKLLDEWFEEMEEDEKAARDGQPLTERQKRAKEEQEKRDEFLRNNPEAKKEFDELTKGLNDLFGDPYK